MVYFEYFEFGNENYDKSTEAEICSLVELLLLLGCWCGRCRQVQLMLSMESSNKDDTSLRSRQEYRLLQLMRALTLLPTIFAICLTTRKVMG